MDANRRLSEKRRKAARNNAVCYLFLLPWLVMLALFRVYPFFYGIAMSLFNVTYKGALYIGTQNYRDLFTDTLFINSILATLRMCAIIIPGTVLVSLWIARAISNRSRALQSTAKIIFYLTSIVCQVALAIAWKIMFNPAYGISAGITDALGLPRLEWFGRADLAIPLISALVMTFTISQPIILFSAAMDNIPVSYYEAASLDGATQRRQYTGITLPLIRPTIVFVLIIATISNLQVFVVPYLLTGGGPNYQTTTILYMVYRNAFEFGRFGYASAMGVILFAVIAVFVFIQYRLAGTETQH